MTSPVLLQLEAVVRELTQTFYVRKASLHPQRIWVDTRRIRHNADFDFQTSDLHRAAKAGLIVERKSGRWSEYTTPELYAELRAEAALTPAERAERTTAAVKEMYLERQVRYGDNVSLWGVSQNLAAVPQDGIAPALASGLLVPSGGGRYTNEDLIPGDEFDAYKEALARFEAAEARAKEIHDAAWGRLVGLSGARTGSLNGERSEYIYTSQIIKLLERIDELEGRKV